MKEMDLSPEEMDQSLAHQIMCFPLISVLKAMNRTKVDYFSLDVEGNELEILKTIPFDEVDITVIINALSWYKNTPVSMP